jgi:hypothetical protein
LSKEARVSLLNFACLETMLLSSCKVFFEALKYPDLAIASTLVHELMKKPGQFIVDKSQDTFTPLRNEHAVV